jgi:DNA replication ATP-dependent helicase Dna2
MDVVSSDLFQKELLKILKTKASDGEAFKQIARLGVLIFRHVTKQESQLFSTFFSRMAYASQQHHLSAECKARCYWLNRRVWALGPNLIGFNDFDLVGGVKALSMLILELFKAELNAELAEWMGKEDDFVLGSHDSKGRHQKIRILVTSVNLKTKELLAESDVFPNEQLRVKFDVAGLNEAFTPSILRFVEVMKGRGNMNLLEVGVEENSVLYPAVLVLEPDYLLDVTTISGAFNSKPASVFDYKINKVKPKESSVAILLGNVMNLMLDELVSSPKADFDESFKKAFKQSPMDFANLSDDQVKDLYKKAKDQFVNLRKVVWTDLVHKNINPNECILEPSFFSETYGIQGRLDLFYLSVTDDKTSIVELKSGSVFNPNNIGLTTPHYIQTLMYYLLVRSVYGAAIDPYCYVLYSREAEALRYAPPSASLESDALNIRNLLVCEEYALSQLDSDRVPLGEHFDTFTNVGLCQVGKFSEQFLIEFAAVWRNSKLLERKYFEFFVAFISREYILAKTGEQDSDTSNGLASLWLKSADDKEDNFNILKGLTLVTANVQSNSPKVVFDRTDASNPLANFRVGDIVVLYPTFADTDTVTSQRLFRCTVYGITQNQVVISLRFRQNNDTLFKLGTTWCIEPDNMDSSYQNQHKSLYQFLSARPNYRNLILGLTPPTLSTQTIDRSKLDDNLSEEQVRVLSKALVTQDYFLLLGPPGTGKTKFMLANQVKYLLENTNENLLLLAFTNRAVDEICDAIHDFAHQDYLRLGSASSLDEKHKGNALSFVLESVNSRKDLAHLFASKRIFVSTVSSAFSNTELFKLKEFDRAIVDEASQLPEPMLVGCLSMVKKFILIGDHKQLPAVVVQNAYISKANDPQLQQIGIDNGRNSLFERLYNLAQANNWGHAYDMLSHQGRMHQDIQVFSAEKFYQNKLFILPEYQDKSRWQTQPLKLDLPENPDQLTQQLGSKRLVWLDSESVSGKPKTNTDEALKCLKIIESIIALYQYNHLALKPEDIGVITPYRAQIAQIRHHIENELPAEWHQITVDTVERYQGGARRIVIISFCANSQFQLENLISLSDDGTVDRKLNVALTRAREHLILIGNPAVLCQNPIYNSLRQLCLDTAPTHG